MKQKIYLFIVVTLFAGSSGIAQVLPDPPEAERIAGYEAFFGGPLSEEEEKEFLDRVSPQLKNDLLRIKKEDEKKYNSLIRRHRYESITLNLRSRFETQESATNNSKKMSELELYSDILGYKYQKASAGDKPKIKTDLMNTLTQLFEMREAEKESEVKALEKKLTDLREKLKLRQENKNEIVERRFQELVGQNKYLRWD
ncbi:MAG: hypothetical protein K9J12_17340 [Melioribacteraceae bacterium]|nr:hypothetical protein [Melioribacteraceae bacterium]MCF8263456.1 hypothetical protein [Melioribacteraceae bacterium]MCF8414072.1 hypothetical protein [Melioribacteraceae bacterium]MCF8430999.1 hypothetical protein [Melioribacteraceae bacterium]